MNSVNSSSTPDGYPQQLRINFMKMQMSTLMSYTKAFGLITTKDMSHMELANLVANHFVGNTVDESKVIKDFYEKTETLKRNSEQAQADNSSYSVPKRQTKKPKKYTQNEEGTFHYNTRSRTNDNTNKDKDKETTSTDNPDHVKYCICNKPENNEMVQCENPNCPHKWFHYSCVGITDPSTLPAKWYCPECTAALKL